MSFERSRSGLVLSDPGKTLRPYAEQLLRTASLARQAVHEHQEGSTGPLQIAAALSISVYFLPDVLKRFQRQHPNVFITIRSGHSKEVLEMLLNEEAEIGLARSLQHPEVETISLREDPLLLAARGSDGGKYGRRAKLEQVASWPLIFYERGSSDWTLTQSLFRRAGLVPNVAMEADSIELTNSPVLILGLPPALVAEARDNAGRPFPWGGDYTGTASVRSAASASPAGTAAAASAPRSSRPPSDSVTSSST